MRKACGVEVLLFEIALCLWIRSSFFGHFKKQNRKGSPTSLIYPLKSKLISFVIKQFFRFGKGTSDSYEIPPAAVLLHPLRSFRKTSTRAEKCLYCSHNNYIPHLLRMTKSAQCFWLKRSFAMPTSKTASCFCWVLFDSARPTRRVGMLRA